MSGLHLSGEQLTALADRAYKVSGHGNPAGPPGDIRGAAGWDQLAAWYQEGYRYGVDVGVHAVLMDLLQIEADDIDAWIEEHRTKDAADD